MKKYITITLKIGLFIMIAAGCKKDTAAINPPVVLLPVLRTSDISAVKKTTAVSGGSITSDGGVTITARGVCWSTKADPTIADSKTTEGADLITFTSLLTGLTNASTYNVRAYATNSAGTAYGNTVIFTALEIGQSYEGGQVAYILTPGDPGYTAGVGHGILVAPVVRQGPKWFNGTYITTAATATALGTGNANTNLIVSKMGAGNYSAALCSSQIIFGYSDWYLPSKDELNKLYLVKDKIPGYFQTGYYWSSSESGNSTVWIQSFDTGVQSSYDKNGSGFYTQAIRSF